MSIKRPHPASWLYYQYAGRLPAAYGEWVLHDGTCRTWMLRVVVRGVLRIAPIAAVLFAVLVYFGGAWPVALGALLLGLLVVLRVTLTGAVESVDARLARHGYPPGHGSAVRNRMDEEAAERYRAVWRNSGD
ncbi:hypothetical protein FHX42_000178 [Saccharopolyspora lacisalsi]|uniref:DUF5313 domain-containing protein n=1 Tax=Halosaccharopolyspora lacisalsi TaxID=1000566 RepID=A0A839DQ32_9PSEU|nr:DUF5313 family protein [Halosaccharopolyspora lacisalsi]MBA8822849.1 hypothetical protein [Halosaccharopolyspora lacisalsi]